MTNANPPPAPRAAAFDWALYAEATFAGLSILIPVPFLDSIFEYIFNRRIAAAVARRAGRKLSPGVLAALNRGDGWLAGCLLWPVSLVWSLLKRVSRKLLYILTINEAADKLSYYWHRAYLLDYMLEAGHLDQPATAEVGREALAGTLKNAGISPLRLLAKQAVAAPTHIWRSLRRVRRGQADAEMQAERDLIARGWEGFGLYLAGLAAHYDRAYAQVVSARQARLIAAEAEVRRDYEPDPSGAADAPPEA